MGMLSAVSRGMRTIRARASAAGQILANGALYQSAGSGYRTHGWHAPLSGPAQAVALAGPDLIRRSRAEFRNNAWARNLAQVLVTNLWGDGFTPHPLFGADDEGANAEASAGWVQAAQRLFRRWGKRADADGGNFESALWTAIHGMVEGGDSFIVRVAGESAGVPMQIRVLEAEMVPHWHNQRLADGYIRTGIEFDLQGRVRAYWMYPEHPGDAGLGRMDAAQLQRIDARNVLHFFRRTRPGQVRGEPWEAPILLRLHDLAGYFDAEVYRKKGAANFVFKLEVADKDKASDAMGELHDKAAQDGVVDTKPGSTVVTGVGEQFSIVQPADVGPNFSPFVTAILREICAAVGVPYALVTGDMSQETYTSHRAALLAFWARCDAFQYAEIVPRLNVLWQWFLDDAVTAGAIAAPRYTQWREDYLDLDWVPPRRDWIDPAKETAALETELEIGSTSLAQIGSQRGQDWRQILREQAQERKLKIQLGLISADAPAKPASGAARRAAQVPDDMPADRRRTGTDG